MLVLFEGFVTFGFCQKAAKLNWPRDFSAVLQTCLTKEVGYGPRSLKPAVPVERNCVHSSKSVTRQDTGNPEPRGAEKHSQVAAE
jgi:hypothetical protein